MSLTLKTTLAKGSSKPALFTRQGGKCTTESFTVKFSFEFEEVDHSPVSIKGTLTPNIPLFSISGDKDFNFIKIIHGSVRSRSVVIQFDDSDDFPTLFRIIPEVNEIIGPDDSSDNSISAQIRLQEQ